MTILDKLKAIISQIEALEEPYDKEIAKNNNNLGKLKIKVNALRQEINSNIRPAIKVVKRRELDELLTEINILQEDTKYLEAQKESDSKINDLINELLHFRKELMNEKFRIMQAEKDIKEKYEKIIENEVNQLWKKEKEFVNARDLYFTVGGKYELGLTYIQI